jgi:hypothetical protein
MDCVGCRDQYQRDKIVKWTIGGAITSGVGIFVPLVLMVWNLIFQFFVAFFCGCGLGVGQVQACLAPVWLCASGCWGCGSCSALGTTWLGIVTFAGFTGAAWYIFAADLIIVAGLVVIAIALGLWVKGCVDETRLRNKVTASAKPANGKANNFEDIEAARLVVPEVNTGELKF